jgi:hypothetical protein
LIGGWQKRTAAVGTSGMHIDVTADNFLETIFERRYFVV